MGEKEKAIADSVATDYTLNKAKSESKKTMDLCKKLNAEADSVFLGGFNQSKNAFSVKAA